MDHIGIDVHKKERRNCILAEGGELIEHRIRTEPSRTASPRSWPGRRRRASSSPPQTPPTPVASCPCSASLVTVMMSQTSVQRRRV